MASTTNIPLTTLAVGSRDFGPASVADADTAVTLSLDRTVAGGLNATPAAQVNIEILQSNDGGATWKMIASAVANGGLIIGRGGTDITVSSIGTTWDPGTSRLAKATVVVTGASVAVAGTLTTR